MAPTRRALLAGAALTTLAAGAGRWPASAQTAAAPTPAQADMPPILFVHGNGDHAAVWITTLWRMESNGIARSWLAALNFTDPNARADDTVEEPGRSSTADQLRELAAAVAELRKATGADKIALVASSRGGYAVRNYLQGGATDVSHAVLCGTPNHGVFDWDDTPNNEFNGRGPFLRRLNAGESEVAPGVAFLTLRSDGFDKYAQPDGRFVGKPGAPTGVTVDGPSLRGAQNLALGQVDHRETAFSPRAFREIFKFIAGREPQTIAIVPEPSVSLSGLVTGILGTAPTNRPVADASVEVFRLSADTGERIGGALHAMRTAADGRWGPVAVEPGWPLEFVLTVSGAPVTHTYRSPFPRSSAVVNLRPSRPFTEADKAAGAVIVMSRPRGYFGLPRDVVLLDGREPADVKPGVPTDSITTLRTGGGDAGRPIVGVFNEERIVARAWPASENRIGVVELTT